MKRVMILLLVCLTMMIFNGNTSAQERVVEVKLKSGKLIRGVVIEKENNVSMTILDIEGNKHIIKANNVSDIQPVENANVNDYIPGKIYEPVHFTKQRGPFVKLRAGSTFSGKKVIKTIHGDVSVDVTSMAFLISGIVGSRFNDYVCSGIGYEYASPEDSYIHHVYLDLRANILTDYRTVPILIAEAGYAFYGNNDNKGGLFFNFGIGVETKLLNTSHTIFAEAGYRIYNDYSYRVLGSGIMNLGYTADANLSFYTFMVGVTL